MVLAGLDKLQYNSMAGERILIVDDTPINLKLTRMLLMDEGYQVLTAGTADEAMEAIRTHHPQVVLADIQLKGMDGLQLTRRIKRDPATREITVIALTAFAMAGDEGRALDAGCDGYITKPIDTRTLGARIREILATRVQAQTAAPSGAAARTENSGAAAAGSASVSPAEMAALRKSFLSEGLDLARQLLVDLDSQFNAAEAARVLHNWVGTGGLLGCTAIGRLAREAEGILETPPLDNTQLRDVLNSIVQAFSSSSEARDEAVPEPIVQALSGKKIALVGFPRAELQGLMSALKRARAIPAAFEPFELPDSATARDCVLAAVHVGPRTSASPWLTPSDSAAGYRPLILAGTRNHLLSLNQSVQSMAREFLMDSWLPEEALVRFALALSPRSRPTEAAQAASTAPAGRPAAVEGRARIVVADDDSTVLMLVRTALRNFGMDCQCASDGPQALEMIRQSRPHAAVLDVNMPRMDGYAVLAAIRQEGIPVLVILLTARQRESDVIRGFSLGADDYMVKPFSPMELVARLKRLLGR
jgi:DNA-binding response OmpR family regulator